MLREIWYWQVATQFHKMQSWSSVLPPTIRDFEVHGECRTDSQMCIFIFILSCHPKLEKQVLMRNMLCEVWEFFFSSGKEESPNWSLIYPDFLSIFTEIWHQYDFIAVTSPSCNCFSHGFQLGAGQKPSQPLAFPPVQIPQQGSGPMGCPTSSLSRDPVGMFHPPWFSRQPCCLLAMGQCQEKRPSQQPNILFLLNLTAAFSFLRLAFLICIGLGLLKFISNPPTTARYLPVRDGNTIN